MININKCMSTDKSKMNGKKKFNSEINFNNEKQKHLLLDKYKLGFMGVAVSSLIFF